jgi:TPR repeat protein
VRALLIIALLAACRREEPVPAAERTPSVAACLGDELGPLRLKWTQREVCEDDRAACSKSCSAGDGDACLTLALKLQISERNQRHDGIETTQLFARACKLGLAAACTNWGAGRLFGDEAADVPCLYRVFAAACDARETFGCSMMARIMIEWPRTPFDPWIGYSQLVNACDRYDGPPCRFLAYYLERGEFGGADAVATQALLYRACEGGDSEACNRERAQDAMH